MKQDEYNGMKIVNANVDQMQVFVIINNIGMLINVDVNVRNCLRKDLFEILVIENVNEIL